MSEGVWHVDKIVGHKTIRQLRQEHHHHIKPEKGESLDAIRYRVRWLGWKIEDDTWEPYDYLGEKNEALLVYCLQHGLEPATGRKINKTMTKEQARRSFAGEEPPSTSTTVVQNDASPQVFFEPSPPSASGDSVSTSPDNLFVSLGASSSNANDDQQMQSDSDSSPESSDNEEDEGLKQIRILADAAEYIGEPNFLPQSDMGTMARSLVGDDEDGSVTQMKAYANNVYLSFPKRVQVAMFCGDIPLVQSLWQEWRTKTGHDEKTLVTELCQQFSAPDDTTLLSALSWDRKSMPCNQTNKHVWCNLMAFLLDKGADVDVRTHGQLWTPLMVAVNKGAHCQVKQLLTRVADPAASGKDGRTPLHLAVERGDLKLVKWLLWQGADPAAIASSASYSNKSPADLSVSVRKRNPELAEWLPRREKALRNTMKSWMREMKSNMNVRIELSPVHMWPVYETGGSERTRSFTIKLTEGVLTAADLKAVVLVICPVLTNEDDSQSPDEPSFLTLKYIREEMRPKIRSVTVNGVEQPVTYMSNDASGESPACWVCGLEPIAAGSNPVQLRFERQLTTATRRMSRCVLVAQSFVCDWKR